jgi:hypothetical protein
MGAPVTQAQQATPEPPNPAVPREMPKRIQPSKIILVGDSTTAVFGGWGPSFCADHVTAFVARLNVARGGRSSRTYMPGTSPCARLRQKAISMSGC